MLHWTLFPGHVCVIPPFPKPTIGAPSLVDVLAGSVTSDKADGTDVGVVADEVDRLVLPVDHIHHSIRAAWKVSPINGTEIDICIWNFSSPASFNSSTRAMQAVGSLSLGCSS